MNTFTGGASEGGRLPLKGSLPLSRLAYRMHKRRENERGIQQTPVDKEHMKLNPFIAPKTSTAVLSEERAKLRDLAVWQVRAGC